MKKILLSQLFLLVLSLGHAALAENTKIEVDLIIKDHKFVPETLTLPAGKKIIITVHNQDPSIEEFESTDLKREKIILGNSKAKVILAPLRPGEYNFFGEFHEETAQGKLIIIEENKRDV